MRKKSVRSMALLLSFVFALTLGSFTIEASEYGNPTTVLAQKDGRADKDRDCKPEPKPEPRPCEDKDRDCKPEPKPEPRPEPIRRPA